MENQVKNLPSRNFEIMGQEYLQRNPVNRRQHVSNKVVTGKNKKDHGFSVQAEPFKYSSLLPSVESQKRKNNQNQNKQTHRKTPPDVEGKIPQILEKTEQLERNLELGQLIF